MKKEITNIPLPSELEEILLASESHASDHLQEVRKWEALITGSQFTPSESNQKQSKTRSNIVIKHVRKLLEWRYPVLEQAFLSRKELFSPTGRDAIDENVAVFHKKILNYQMNNEIDKVTFIARMVRAFLNQGTVIVHLGWRAQKGKKTYIAPVFDYGYVSKESASYEILEKEYIDILATLMDSPQHENSLPIHKVEGAKYYDAHKRVMQVTIKGFTERETENEVYIHNHPTLNVVNIYDVFAAPECRTNIQDSPYVIFRYDAAIEELISNEDFDTDKVDWNSVTTLSGGSSNTLKSIYATDDTRRRVYVYEYWGLHDIDGEGTMEPCKITWVDGAVLECIRNPFPDNKHPFYSAAYSPDVSLESFYGTSDAYLAEDNQNILSAIHRGIIDIHANSAYGQKGIAKNTLDPLNRNKFLKGENFEYDPNTVADPRMLFHTFAFPEISPSTMAYLQQINADSDALTGIKSFNEGISGASLGNTAAGVSGVLSATALRESAIIGRLEAMLVQIAKRIMQFNILYLDTDKIIQLAGPEGLIIKAVPNPLIDIKLDITNQAEDAMKAQEMSFMLQTLGAVLPPPLIKAALMEISELRNLNKFYNILEEFEMTPSEPDPMAQKIAELQIALLEAQVANERAIAEKNNITAQLTQAKVGTEQATTEKTAAEAQQINVKTERLVTGQDTEDKIRVISAQGESNTAATLVKTHALKGYNPTV